MKIVNRSHHYFHTPLTGKQLLVAVSIVISYLCITMLACFVIPELSTYMYISFIVIIILLGAIIKLCDYLYKKQQVK